MNIAAILKKCPKGTKLYSPIYGELELIGVDFNEVYPISCLPLEENSPDPRYLEGEIEFTEYGRYLKYYPHSECLLFPSEDQRDWSKFVVPDTVPDKESDQSHKFKSFDKVLVRDDDDEKWMCIFFSRLDENGDYICVGSDCSWEQCIPYEGNEHLLGTTNKPE